ncbi:MAG TPA: nucleotidyl transferase AbiEii/AbiGii toxin family protein [Bryobacteraceae bacterium]|nr:nucleotidyl transferase AbiEii/AbiGii toxin family protein [Bryobacteraceae bacterium]
MLNSAQIEDLAQLHAVAERFAAEVVIIGAAALLCFIDLGRFTRDVDLVVALDLADFAAFSSDLKAIGWIQESGREHRWRGSKGSLIDLVPAGVGLRAAAQLVWPDGSFAMSLVGFEHVFTRSKTISLGPGAWFKVAPPPVIALLKMVASSEDPHRRRKDLDDLESLLRQYEAKSDRIFGDDVFAAELDDFEYANAFLLGSDVGAIATDKDAEIVLGFLSKQRMRAEELAALDRDDFQREALRFQMQLKAFQMGFNATRLK